MANKRKSLEALEDLKDCGQTYIKKEFNKRLATIEKDLVLCDALVSFFNLIVDNDLRTGFVSAKYKDVDEEAKKILSEKQFNVIKEMLKDE